MSTSVRIVCCALLAISPVLFAGCAANPAPTFEANADRTLPLPAALSSPGTQAKIQMPDKSDPILVWRTEIGFGGTAIKCTHCFMQVRYNPDKGRLECPARGCWYKLDGTVMQGPTRTPLRAYLVDFDGNRLRILG